MFKKLKNIEGMEITETAIMLALIAIASIGILTVFGNNVRELFYKSHDKVKNYKAFDFSANAQQNQNTTDSDTSGQKGPNVTPTAQSTNSSAPTATRVPTIASGDDGGTCVAHCSRSKND